MSLTAEQILASHKANIETLILAAIALALSWWLWRQLVGLD